MLDLSVVSKFVWSNTLWQRSQNCATIAHALSLTDQWSSKPKALRTQRTRNYHAELHSYVPRRRRVGVVVKALAFHQCGLGSTPASTLCNYVEWVCCFQFSTLLREVFALAGYFGYPTHQKSKFSLVWFKLMSVLHNEQRKLMAWAKSITWLLLLLLLLLLLW